MLSWLQNLPKVLKMPLFRYQCSSDQCGDVTQLLRDRCSKDNPVTCDKCGATTIRLLSEPLGAIVTETPDKNRGKSVKVGLNDQLKKRAHEHFVKHEMDDLIQKHGIRHARDVGWIDRKTGRKRGLIDEK